MTSQFTVDPSILWWIFSYQIVIEQKTLEIAICLESQTLQIRTSLLGTKSIASQNLVRKLTNVIEERIQTSPNSLITLYTENKAYLRSKLYQKLFENYSNLCPVQDISESFRIEKENLSQALRSFQTSSIGGKTLEQVLKEEFHQKDSLRSLRFALDQYVKEWNQNQPSVKILLPQRPLQNSKIVQVTHQLEKLVSKASENSVTYDQKNEIEFISNQLDQLNKLILGSTFSMAGLVDQKTEELAQQIETIDRKVDEVSSDLKQLLPTQKTKYNPRPLRDPITPELFQLLLFNVGSRTNYKKKIRQAQLRIAYTFLYYLGLRLNELQRLTLEDIQEALERSELRVTIYKTNRSHNYTLPRTAKKDLQKILPDLKYLQYPCQFRYLFGKTKPPHKKTLLRIVNQDLANTCQLCGITDNISSHSFRVSVISKLLRVTTVQNVADIMGHQDIRSTMKYSRYRLPKSMIQEIHQKAEDSLLQNSW